MSAQTVEASDFSTELSHESTNMAYHLLGSYQNSIYLGSITTDQVYFLHLKKMQLSHTASLQLNFTAWYFFKKKTNFFFKSKPFFSTLPFQNKIHPLRENGCPQHTHS